MEADDVGQLEDGQGHRGMSRDLGAALRAVERMVADRNTAASAKERRKERLRSLGVDYDEDAHRRAQECGCFACPDCRPEVAYAAEVTGVAFLNVLLLVQGQEEEALDRLMDLRGPVVDRAQKRRQERLVMKREKRRVKAQQRIRSLDPLAP